ncbi:MAG: hydroxyethylthiazole kinase [Pseudomonadota bacterium]
MARQDPHATSSAQSKTSALEVHAVDLALAAAALQNVRVQGPRVHCITNSVVQNFTANALLAVGAIPSMTINPDEIADFVAGADALLVNLGTVDRDRSAAIPLAFDAADAGGRPVVLDPVFIDRSPGRAAFARKLMKRNPAIVRANRPEWEILAGVADADPTHVWPRLSGQSVAVVTGPEDRLVATGRSVTLIGGHPFMARVTGVGCAQAAIMAALAACAETPFHGALAGLILFDRCGERAAGWANGPGTFEAALLDALYQAEPEMIAEQAVASRSGEDR